MKKTTNIKWKDIFSFIGAGAVIASGIFLSYKAFKYGDEYLRDNLDENTKIPEPVRTLFITHDNSSEANKKFKEIERMLNSENKNESYAGTMLMCATLERILAKKYIDISEKNSINKRKHAGMVDLSRYLRSMTILDITEHEEIVRILEAL